jgi:hypothetical protein
MKAVCSLVALGVVLSSPALAATEPNGPAPFAESGASSESEPSREALQLARQFVALLYPAEQQDDWIELLREGPPEDFMQNAALRTSLKKDAEKAAAKLTKITERRLPALMDAYAHSYAREYSEGELRDLIAFAITPTGRHFMYDMDFADDDPAVTAVQAEMGEEMAPIIEGLQKAMCQAATEVRVAAGETDAKCSMA